MLLYLLSPGIIEVMLASVVCKCAHRCGRTSDAGQRKVHGLLCMQLQNCACLVYSLHASHHRSWLLPVGLNNQTTRASWGFAHPNACNNMQWQGLSGT